MNEKFDSFNSTILEHLNSFSYKSVPANIVLLRVACLIGLYFVEVVRWFFTKYLNEYKYRTNITRAHWKGEL